MKQIVTFTIALALANLSLGVTHAQDQSNSSIVNSLATSATDYLEELPASEAETSAEPVETKADSRADNTAVTDNSSDAAVSESSAEPPAKLAPSTAQDEQFEIENNWVDCMVECMGLSWQDALYLAVCCMFAVSCPWCVAAYGTIAGLCGSLCMVYGE